jgi:hypothetical protein
MSGLSGFGMSSSGTNGNGTQTCPAHEQYCLTLHCDALFGGEFIFF